MKSWLSAPSHYFRWGPNFTPFGSFGASHGNRRCKAADRLFLPPHAALPGVGRKLTSRSVTVHSYQFKVKSTPLKSHFGKVHPGNETDEHNTCLEAEFEVG